jgi:hypothetical protein
MGKPLCSSEVKHCYFKVFVAVSETSNEPIELYNTVGFGKVLVAGHLPQTQLH